MHSLDPSCVSPNSFTLSIISFGHHALCFWSENGPTPHLTDFHYWWIYWTVMSLQTEVMHHYWLFQHAMVHLIKWLICFAGALISDYHILIWSNLKPESSAWNNQFYLQESSKKKKKKKTGLVNSGNTSLWSAVHSIWYMYAYNDTYIYVLM